MNSQERKEMHANCLAAVAKIKAARERAEARIAHNKAQAEEMRNLQA